MKEKRDQNVLLLISSLRGMNDKCVHMLNANTMYDEGVCVTEVINSV